MTQIKIETDPSEDYMEVDEPVTPVQGNKTEAALERAQINEKLASNDGSTIPEAVQYLQQLVERHENSSEVTPAQKKELGSLKAALVGDGSVITKTVSVDDKKEEGPYINEEQLLQKIQQATEEANQSIVPTRVTADGELASYPEILWDRNQPVLHRVASPEDFRKFPYLEKAWRVCTAKNLPEGQLAYEWATNGKGQFSMVAYNRMFFHVVSYKSSETNAIPFVSIFFTHPPRVTADHWKKIELFVRGDPEDLEDKRHIGLQKVIVFVDHATAQFISGHLTLACIPKEEMEKRQPSVLCLMMGGFNSKAEPIPSVEYVPRMRRKGAMAQGLAKDEQKTMQDALKLARLKKIDTESIGYKAQVAAFQQRQVKVATHNAQQQQQQANNNTESTPSPSV